MQEEWEFQEKFAVWLVIWLRQETTYLAESMQAQQEKGFEIRLTCSDRNRRRTECKHVPLAGGVFVALVMSV